MSIDYEMTLNKGSYSYMRHRGYAPGKMLVIRNIINSNNQPSQEHNLQSESYLKIITLIQPKDKEAIM